MRKNLSNLILRNQLKVLDTMTELIIVIGSAPLKGPHWQCMICSSVFFPTKEQIIPHMKEEHNISNPLRLKQNIERIFCT